MHMNKNNWQIGGNSEIQDKCQIKNSDLGIYKYDYFSVVSMVLCKNCYDLCFLSFSMKITSTIEVLILFLGILLVSVLFWVVF